METAGGRVSASHGVATVEVELRCQWSVGQCQ